MSSISALGGASSAASFHAARAAERTRRPDPAEMQQQLFAKMDTDGSGDIGSAELQAALGAAEGGAQVDAAAWLSQMDTDGSGGIGLEEFGQALDAVRPAPPGPPPMSTTDFASGCASRADETIEALMSLDTDGDGAISASEIDAFREALGGGTGSSGAASTEPASGDADLFGFDPMEMRLLADLSRSYGSIAAQDTPSQGLLLTA